MAYHRKTWYYLKQTLNFSRLFVKLIFLQIFQVLLICHGFLAILALPAMEDLPDVEIIPSIDTSISTGELK